MLKLALRNVLRQGARSTMIAAAAASGTAALILIGGFIQDMFVQLAESTIHAQTGHVQIARPGYFSGGSRSPEKQLLSAPDALKKVAEALPEVQAAMARMSFSGLLSSGRSDYAVVGEGVEVAKEARLGTSLTIARGRYLLPEDAYGMLVGEGVAQALGVGPADRVNLVLATADGAINLLDFEIVGVFRTFSKDYDARAVRVPIGAAQELLNSRGANLLVVALNRTEDTKRVAANLAAAPAFNGLEVRSWDEVDDFYPKAVLLYERQFGVLRLIVVVLVLLSVSNVVNMSVFDRAAEFCTMRALGNRAQRVVLVVLIEGLVLGTAGAVAGAVAGLGLAWLVSSIGIPMPPPPNSNMEYIGRIQVDSSVVLGAMLVGLIATVAACIIPALRVSRMPIIEGLRRFA